MAPQAKLDTRTRDRAIPEEERRRQGAFYTPTLWVDEAHKMVSEVLGPNWRDECVVWDCAAGTANLTRDYTFRDLILSTIDQADIDSIGEEGINPGAWIFGYDFLDDDSSPFFSGKNVIPSDVDAMLKAAARDGKRLVFFINPPYGTANNAGTQQEGDHKAGIALTATNTEMKKAKIGASSQQLYAQFMFRAAKLAEEYGFAQSTVAAFTKPTFMSSGSYKGFRDFWYQRHAYQGGMLFQASHFADVSGRWGISFTVWSEGKTDSAVTLPITLKDVADYTVVPTGIKAIYTSDGRDASSWILKGPKGTGDSPKFSSGLKVREGYVAGQAPGSLGVFCNMGNNLVDSAQGVMLLCGKPTHKGRCHVDMMPGESFRRCMALYAARKLVAGTWVNDKDEYLTPTDTGSDAYKQWNDDCVVYALLHNANNCTAMRDVQHGQEPVGDAKCVVTTGTKAVYNSDGREASEWVREPTKGLRAMDAPQFSSGLKVKEGPGCRGTMVHGSLGYFGSSANNLADSDTMVYLVSGTSSRANGCSVLPGESFRRCTALYAARKLVTGTWVNDKDEYLRPTDTTDAYKQWNDDAVVYALLHNANNCTAMRDVQYKSKTWRIRNHFWWKTRAQSKELYDRPDTQGLYSDVRGETDPYLAEILPTLNLSPEARECLRILDTLLVETLPHRESFATSRPELHLGCHDAGIYQLKTLAREVAPMTWKALQVAFRALGDKLRPGVFDHGFLLR